MKRQVKVASGQSLTYIDAQNTERCRCLPPAVLHQASIEEQQQGGLDNPQVTPITAELKSHLYRILSASFPRSTPLSLLLLHISQLEHVLTAKQETTPYQYLRLHAPSSFLDQVLVNVRRTIRAGDQILAHEGIAAVIIFPDVDQQGIYRIAERVYQGISLLQAETVIPPLRRITDVLIGVGSYPEPAASLEELLYHLGLIAHKLTFRPAIGRQPRSVKSTHTAADKVPEQQFLLEERKLQGEDSNEHISSPPRQAYNGSIPFMQLPSHIPRRLQQIIPYQLALAIGCVPVGRDRNRLTIAMADPANMDALTQLEKVTGLTIFAVSCEAEVLKELLAKGW
jgi:Type II secretion system (T2SS), protein E, N-terminal domain